MDDLPEGMVIKSFKPASDIPVTHNGNIVGKANIDENGKIDMILEGPLATDIVEKLSIGLAAAVIVDPTCVSGVGIPRPRRS